MLVSILVLKNYRKNLPISITCNLFTWITFRKNTGRKNENIFALKKTNKQTYDSDCTNMYNFVNFPIAPLPIGTFTTFPNPEGGWANTSLSLNQIHSQ